ncbi:DUF4652 domain-containing protein [Clostridium sp.]|uniref:DUF4652 domain-containing protein n=1 Tax=Clostridium sp. TaxID=1506 RepID=UPI00321669FA
MKCSQCKDKLTEYIEGNLSAELDEDIKSHLLTCDSCKESYKKELMKYKAFKAAFLSDNVGFKFSTDTIMNSIDKNKYTKGGIKMKKKYKGVLAIAAAFLLGVVVTPITMKLINNDKNIELSSASTGREDKSRIAIENNDADGNAGESLEAVPDILSKNGDGASDKATVGAVDENVVEVYSKVEVPTTQELTFNTPFIATADEKYKATIEGKGETANEEGIGKIYIKDTVNNKMYKYEVADLNNLEGNQLSPLSINWYDNTNIMIVQGKGYGTLVNGSEIIIMDVTTGQQRLVSTAVDREGFVSIEKVGNDLKIKCIKYLDDALNEYEDVEKIIQNYNLGDVIE